MASKLVIISLCIVCALGEALGQAVSTRSASPDETRLVVDPEASVGGGGGGQTRTIYSQRQLTPHRMMHFGKRPIVQVAPGLLELYDPVQKQQQQQQQQRRSQRSVGTVGNFPFTLYFDLAPNRVLEPVLDDALIKQDLRQQQAAELVELVLEQSKPKDYGQQKQKRLSQQPSFDWASGGNQQLYYTNEPVPAFKMMHMIDSSKADSNGFDFVQPNGLLNGRQSAKLIDTESKADQQAAAGEDVSGNKQQQQAGDEQATVSGSSDGASQQQQQQQQLDNNGINIDQRSRVPVHLAQGDDLMSKIVRAQILNKMLYGQPIATESSHGNSHRNLGNFIKKAEPQRMTFMHFGR